MDCCKLAWIMATEGCRYLWYRDPIDSISSLSRRCIRVNIVFVKIFQAVAVKYLGSTLKAEMIPYDPEEIDLPSIDGLSNLTIIGAGMISIVFEGTLNGKSVVIKTRRKNIEAKIERGLLQTDRILRLLQYLPLVRPFNVHTFVAEIRESFYNQLSYASEARFQEKFSEAFSYAADVRIPKIIQQSDTFILMEKLAGVSFADIPADSKVEYLKILAKVILKSNHIDGIMHGDLHVGNVVFMPGPTLGVIDFGLSYDMSRAEQNFMFHLLGNLVKKDYSAAAKLFVDDCLVHPLAAPERGRAADEISRLLEHCAETTMLIGLSEIVQICQVMRRHRGSMDPKCYRLLMAVAASDILMQQLSPLAITHVSDIYRSLFLQ